MSSLVLLPLQICYRIAALPITIVLFWLKSLEVVLGLLDRMIKLLMEQVSIAGAPPSITEQYKAVIKTPTDAQSTTDESSNSASPKRAAAAEEPSSTGPVGRNILSLADIGLVDDGRESNCRDESPVMAPSEPAKPSVLQANFKTQNEFNRPQPSIYQPRPTSHSVPPPSTSYQSPTSYFRPPSSSFRPGADFARSTAPWNEGCRSLPEIYKDDPAGFSEALANLHEQVCLEDTNDPEHSTSLEMLGDVLFRRFEFEGNPDDLDSAIAQHREALACRGPGHPRREVSFSDLARVLMSRYENMGDEDAKSEAYKYAQEASILCAGGRQGSSGSGGATGFGSRGPSTRFSSMGESAFNSFGGANGVNLGGPRGRYSGGGDSGLSYQGAFLTEVQEDEPSAASGPGSSSRG